jgi:hypothetical protein
MLGITTDLMRELRCGCRWQEYMLLLSDVNTSIFMSQLA